MLESALASTTKGKGNSGKLQPGIGDEAYVAGGENRHQSGTGKLAGADWQMQPDIAQLQPCAEIHEVCANHPKKSTTDVTLQNNACNYPGGEVVNSVPELHHQHKEPHHVGMDDSMVQVERETRVLKKKVTSAHSVEDEVYADHPKKATTDVTLQNNACNYPGGEVVNSVPELHHQHKEPHHVGMDDSMVQVEREPCADDVGNPGIGVRVGSESTLTPTLVIPGPGPVTCEADACGNHDATTPRPGLPTTPSASGTPVSRPRARDSWQQPSQKLLRALDASQTVPACMTPQAPSECGSMASGLSTLTACDLRTAVEAVNGFAMAAQTSPKARRD